MSKKTQPNTDQVLAVAVKPQCAPKLVTAISHPAGHIPIPIPIPCAPTTRRPKTTITPVTGQEYTFIQSVVSPRAVSPQPPQPPTNVQLVNRYSIFAGLSKVPPAEFANLLAVEISKFAADVKNELQTGAHHEHH